MAYDTRRRRTVLHGGMDAALRTLDDTWEWDGTTWVQIQTGGRPPARAQHGMAFDSRRGVVVLFGGTPDPTSFSGMNDTWEWDGTNWTQAMPSSLPRRRLSFGMAYDTRRQGTVLFGGADGVFAPIHGDTWEWDGVDWVQRAATSAPAPRYDTAAAYDEARGEVVLYGGADWFRNWDDTWRYAPTHPAQSVAFGLGCAGSVGVPVLAPADVGPWLQSSFDLRVEALPAGLPAVLFLGFSDVNWQGIPLPVDLTPLGLTGCSLRVSIPLVFAGARQGSAATWSLPVSGGADLLGFRFFTQSFHIDPLANPFGATTSNGLAHSIGGR